MNLYRSKKGAAVMWMCCILILTVAIFPERAPASYRALKITLLASSVASTFGSVFLKTSAQNSYDQYLRTAVQTDLTQYRNNYTSKRNASVVMSRIGYSLGTIATLISVFEQLDVISQRSSSKTTGLRFTNHYNHKDRETTFQINGQF